MKAQTQKKKIIPQPKPAQKPKKNIVEQIENLLQHKITTIILMAIVTAVFYSNYSAIFDEKINLGGDNIVYYSCGKAIAEGEGYSNVIFLEKTPHTHFPPGYSLFIAGLQKILPNDILFVKKVNGVLLWLSLLLLFLLVKRITNNTLVAFCTALFSAIQTTLLFFSTVMMSEILFIFISLTAIHLALYLNEKLFLKKGGWKTIVLLVFFLLNVVYVYFVRSVGVSMVLALGAWFGILAIQSFLLYRKEKRKETETTELPVLKTWLLQRMIICVLIAASFLSAHTLWSIRQANMGRTGSSYEGVFFSKTGGETMTTWNDWKTRIKHNIAGDITKWVPNVLFGTPYDNEAKATTAQWLKGILMCLVLLAGLFCLKKQSFWIIFLYVGFSMLILMLFPEQYQGNRYLAPLIPFFIFLFFNGIANIVSFACLLLPKKPKAFIPQTVVLLAVCIFWLYPDYIKAQSELRETSQLKTWEELKDPKMNAYLEACKFCKDNLPDSIRVITRKPELFYMFSGYKKSASFPWYAEPDTIMAYLKKQQTTHVILDDWYRHAYVTLYPAVQKNPEKFKVLKEIGKVDTTAKLNPTYVLEFNDEWGYHGERIDGKKTGKGYELFQDGRKYVGHYENNMFSGEGTFYDKDGKVIYKGLWRDGTIIKGEGELNYVDGRKYVGQFNNNIPDGYGTLYDTDGKVIGKGKWRNGMLVSAE